MASGLRVNFQKSTIYGVGVTRDEVNGIAERFQCQKGDLPFEYLGLPIGSNMKRSNEWKPVIEKFHKKLSGWKVRSISFGERLTLVKSALSSLPLYFFLNLSCSVSCYKSP
ncbi:uncharacterized protein [Rutidosis leptorrhynchoides]|uniref:uncharacterized protein n=1 Tax=Rutidosis leptorrhynchoides TaxID=125765 RepID=UPI003A98FB1D